MTPDEAEFAAYMAHPDTNREVFSMLFDDCFSDPEYAGTMKVISVIMREVELCPEITGSQSQLPSPARS